MRVRVALCVLALVAGIAGPAYAASNPKSDPTQFIWCPNDPGRAARIWLTPGKKWTADNQCGHGTWLSIGWAEDGSEDSEEVLLAPKTRFGPRKSGSMPGPGDWWGASLTTQPEFCDGDTSVVWPNSKGVFEQVC